MTEEMLTQVGYYCWRCQGLNLQACRSDAVPIYVPAQWAEEMVKEMEERGHEHD